MKRPNLASLHQAILSVSSIPSSVVFSFLWIFIYAYSLFLLGMSDGDAMDDIVDELGEDEIMEESGKLFIFLQYLNKQ